MHHTIHTNTIPDYTAAQFPGGGGRGYATVKLLEWFEKTTDLPIHQLLPHVITGSVGILIASSLYLPHPEHPKAARMSARQLADIFPAIAARTPQPAKFKNTNSREPFAEAIEPFIGHGKLEDFLGTVFFSSHEIGGLSKSSVMHGKLISPTTGEATYVGDPQKRILDIAFAGTSLPSLFPAYDDQIDLAFSEVPSNAMIMIKRLFPRDAKGAFVRVGNFRSQSEKARKHLHSAGYLSQTLSSAITGAISDHIYSQTLNVADTIFDGRVFNLEYEIEPNYIDPPKVQANITTDEQFRKIEMMTEKFILDNLVMMTQLAHNLKISALKRMAEYPDTAFGIAPKIQEFPLCAVPVLSNDHETKSHAVLLAAERLTKGFGEVALHSFRGALEMATTDSVKHTTQDLLHKIDKGLSGWGEILLPNSRRRPTEVTQPVLPPSAQSHELF